MEFRVQQGLGSFALAMIGSRSGIAGFAVALGMAASTAAIASPEHPHQYGHLRGEHLELVYTQHTISGSVAQRPVFASPLKDEFGIQLFHRIGEQTFESVFRSEQGALKADVETLQGSPLQAANIVLEISAVDFNAGSIKGNLDDQSFEVLITADEMNGHHFVDPQFVVSIDDHEVYSFALENGQVCMGCAAKVVYVVLTMLRGAQVI